MAAAVGAIRIAEKSRGTALAQAWTDWPSEAMVGGLLAAAALIHAPALVHAAAFLPSYRLATSAPAAPSSIRCIRMLAGESDLSKLTVKQLKEQLREAGLPVSGLKAELIARLEGSPPIDAAAAAPLPPPAVTVSSDEMASILVEIEHCKS